MNNDIKLDYDAFLRSIYQNKDTQFSMFLGAGASIISQIQSASDCIWEWKRDIYKSCNPDSALFFNNYKSEEVRKKIQCWIDNQGGYPSLNSPEEYSFYVEKAYKIPDDRMHYFARLSESKEPYIGYKLLCLLSKYGIIKSVWTTNFDGLVERAAHKLNITPINVNLDDPNRIFRNLSANELLYVALHGDYKYSFLKNTSKELDCQNSIFSDVFSKYMFDKSLIVIGYSGRDESIMKILEKTFLANGTGRIYWCGYNENIPKNIEDFLNKINKAGRNAFYISTSGFDKILCDWCKLIVEDNPIRAAEYDNILRSIKVEKQNSPFQINDYICNKQIKTNFHPITFPKDIFKFKVIDAIKGYKEIQKLTENTKVIAAPIDDDVYALSSYEDTLTVFKDLIKGSIARVPIDVREIEHNAMLIKIMKSALLKIISQKTNLATDSKSGLWKKESKQIFCNNKYISVHDGIKIKLNFYGSEKYAFLSIRPFVKVGTELNISMSDKICINKYSFDKLYNNKYDELLDEWNQIIFSNNDKIIENYPLNSNSEFKFVVSNNVAYAGLKIINNNNYKYYPAKDIPEKQVVFKGIVLSEPNLQFSVKLDKPDYSIDFHPMRGLLKYKPYDDIQNDRYNLEDILLSVVCPKTYMNMFFDFLCGINKIWKTNVNIDYLIDYPGFESIYNTKITIPEINSAFWADITEKYKSEVLLTSAYELARNITSKIEMLANKSTHSVIIIFIPNSWNEYKHIENENEVFDLHDYIKAFAVQKGINTQVIEESTLSDSLKCQIYWWLSLSFYVKALKTPWILAGTDKRTAFAGIGYSIKHTANTSHIIMGCSHIYSSDGLGLKYRLSNIKDYVLDNKKNPYLKYNEAYKLGISICELFISTLQEFPKRVVIHKRTDFRKEEIEGLIDSISQTGITDIDLVSINFDTDAKFFSLKTRDGKTLADDFPITRGTCVLLSSQSAYLWTHGIVPSVRKESYRYYQGGHSIPTPLLITRYYGNTNINMLANEILGLTKMNWNSFNLYTKLPATIDSSNQIARIGNLLTSYNGQTYDYRYFI